MIKLFTAAALISLTASTAQAVPADSPDADALHPETAVVEPVEETATETGVFCEWILPENLWSEPGVWHCY